jgi:nucleotide-binding universal stress UspA family protein
MLDFSHVITGTDFSESSKGGVRESLRIISGDPSRRLTLVHVAKSIKDAGGLKGRMREWVSQLPEFNLLPDPDKQVLLDLEEGKVSVGLARSAARAGATQIIVGPLPRNILEKYLTGAVAEKLFHSANVRVPVMATRGPAEGGYRHILVPVDFSPSSRRAAAMAASFIRDSPDAVAKDARIELLHVGSNPGIHVDKDLLASMVSEIENDLKVFASEEGLVDLVQECHALMGVVQEVIPREVESCGADLVCMGSGSGGGLLGSTVDAVLRNVNVPLLVSPAE